MKKLIEWIKSIPDYLKSIYVEAKRVSWPGKKEIWGSTLVVIILIIIFGIIIGIFDMGISRGLNLILK